MPIQTGIPILPFVAKEVPEASLLPLGNTEWKEGGSIVYASDPGYRHGLVAVMSENGNWQARFADGKIHNFYRMTTIIGKDGHSRVCGGHAIPEFPNGDLLMILVQRPGIIVSGRRSNRLSLDLEDVDGGRVYNLGPMESLEFPGGSIDPEDGSVELGTLRELFEESGIDLSGQTVTIIQDRDPILQQIADTIVYVYNMRVKIPDVPFPKYVENDDGIKVLRISRKDFEYNFRTGAIVAGSTVHARSFLRDIDETATEMWIEGKFCEKRDVLIE